MAVLILIRLIYICNILYKKRKKARYNYHLAEVNRAKIKQKIYQRKSKRSGYAHLNYKAHKPTAQEANRTVYKLTVPYTKRTVRFKKLTEPNRVTFRIYIELQNFNKF